MEFLRKYGVADSIRIPIVKRAVVDLAVGADWTPAAGDVKISKDGGAAANVTNLPTAVAMGNTAYWEFDLTATEMEAANIVVTVADSATKAVEDQTFIVTTYGHASAKHAVDLDDSVRAGLTALPNAAAEAAGGLYTRGSGAGQINQPANGQIDSNVAALGGTVQSATDLKDFADDGYDPATNKVQGVVLVDSLTALANDAISAGSVSAGAVEKVLRSVSGTADSGSDASNIVDAERSESVADYWKGCVVVPTSGANIHIPRRISAFNQTTDTITVAPAWPSAMAASDTYIIIRPAFLEVLVNTNGDKTGYALTSGERDSIASALLDLSNGVETGYTLRQALRLMAAVICGKASGGPGSSVFRNLPDSADRVAATADSSGNRSAMTLTP